MSLQIWLPLIRDANNQGLKQATTITNGSNINFTTGGKLGKCISTSSSSNNTSVITIPGLSNILANGKKYSVSCWVKITGNVTGSGSSWIVKLGSNSCGLWWAASEARWVWNENDNGKRCANPTISGDTTKWHHLVTTIDKSVSGFVTANHYVDGLPADSYETQTWDNSSHSQPTGDTITLTPYASLLNDVRIYDHCLSVKEIKELSKGLVLHYKLSGVGGENLLKNSNFLQGTNGMQGYTATGSTCTKQNDCMKVVSTSASSGFYTSNFNDITTGDMTTFSAYVKADNNMTIYIGVDGSGNGSCTSYSIETEWKRISITKAKTTNNPNLRIYGNGTFYAKELKYELGEIATPWCPNSSDDKYTSMGFNDGVEYDVSGYKYNGIKNNISWSSNTVRYTGSYLFDGSSSYVKTSSTPTFIQQGIEELTVSIWGYMDDWSTFSSRLYSCTENGGFNIENSNTNLCCCVNVYTDAEKTSYSYPSGAYLYIPKSYLTSGWHMFTWVYNTSGTKIFIDGVLYTSKSYTSYGIHLHDTVPIAIGAEVNATDITTPYFNDKLNDFRVYATALSSDDILELYNTVASIDNNANLYAYEVIEQ